jgi:hypothetical protein
MIAFLVGMINESITGKSILQQAGFMTQSDQAIFFAFSSIITTGILIHFLWKKQ